MGFIQTDSHSLNFLVSNTFCITETEESLNLIDSLSVWLSVCWCLTHWYTGCVHMYTVHTLTLKTRAPNETQLTNTYSSLDLWSRTRQTIYRWTIYAQTLIYQMDLHTSQKHNSLLYPVWSNIDTYCNWIIWWILEGAL